MVKFLFMFTSKFLNQTTEKTDYQLARNNVLQKKLSEVSSKFEEIMDCVHLIK